MNLYSNTKTVIKPWGKEIWLHLDNNYCYKRIYIKKGFKTSFQYHLQKSETNFIIDGEAEVWLEDDNGVVQKYRMHGGDYFTVTPPKKHRVIAISDIVLQEVSTPHVDDVIRINDEFHRGDGKIESEHQTPAFVILAAGKGERVKSVTRGLHKGLLKIGDKAAISHIIDQVPSECEIVIVLGYNGLLIKEYCLAAYPEKKFTWVEVQDYESPESGPGKSILAAKDKLNRPFYFCTVDCIFTSLPPMDCNWIGVSDTDLPEIYSTAKIDESKAVLDFKNKSKDGYDKAFCGLAFIRDYQLFWDSLAENKEIVHAFENAKFNLFAKDIKWFDIGTIDGYSKIGEISQKNIAEETYIVNGIFIKINLDKQVNPDRIERALVLKNLVPKGTNGANHCLYYPLMDGGTLYELDYCRYYEDLINFVFDNIDSSVIIKKNEEDCWDFYYGKSYDRIEAYFKKYPEYQDVSLFNKINQFAEKCVEKAELYNYFHGDLQPDNVFRTNDNNHYYIDWRPNFGGNINGGDIYYDLGKLYGGLNFDYRAAKDLSVFEKGEIPQSEAMKSGLAYFEKKISEKGYSLKHIRKMTGLIWINMAPLHLAPMDKILWENGWRLLNEN